MELPLCSGDSLAGLGCCSWKLNETKFYHVGSTGGRRETISGTFYISFGSGLEVHSATYYCLVAVVQVMNNMSFIQLGCDFYGKPPPVPCGYFSQDALN